MREFLFSKHPPKAKRTTGKCSKRVQEPSVRRTGDSLSKVIFVAEGKVRESLTALPASCVVLHIVTDPCQRVAKGLWVIGKKKIIGQKLDRDAFKKLEEKHDS